MTGVVLQVLPGVGPALRQEAARAGLIVADAVAPAGDRGVSPASDQEEFALRGRRPPRS